MRRWAWVAGVALLLAGCGGVWLDWAYEAPGPLSEAAALVVPRGGLGPVGDSLAAQGAVERPLLFRLAAVVTSGAGALRAGELVFPAHASLRQVLAVLRTGRPVQHRLTIPEGLTALQVASLIERAEAATGEVAVAAEGSILPETYRYERGTAREQLVERGRLAMERALELAWSTRTPGLMLANAQEALVLASIVERETARAEERPLIAGVFLNRLRLGMKLQSDATVVYGASGGAGVLDHGLTRAELERDSPWNTYRNAGLPGGPICMPGVASLRAVTQPAVTEALYFVADGTGGHAFSRTQEEHLRRVARWREIERVRNAAVP